MNALIQSLSSWWSSISQREQRMLAVCSVLLLLGAAYWGLVQPMSARSEAAQVRINNEKQLLQWVTQSADQIVELRNTRGVATSAQPFNQVVSTSAKTYKIELIRIQPREDMLQVWVKPVAFNQFVYWLAYLQQKQGVQVEFMDISKSSAEGMIEVKRLQLKRGG